MPTWENTRVRAVGETTPALPCRSCGCPTIHDVLARHGQRYRGVEHKTHVGVVERTWVIGRCQGCGTVVQLLRVWSSFDEYAHLTPMETWVGYEDAWHWELMGKELEPVWTAGPRPPLLRVMAWNIRHGGGKRVKDIAARIVRHRPDVVILTEYQDGRSAQELRGHLEDIGIVHAHAISAPVKANGVLIASREFFEAPIPLAPSLDKPHMLLSAQVAGIGMVGVYMPNGEAKTLYWQAVIAAAKERVERPTLFIGDFNTGKHFLDEPGATLVSAPFMDDMEAAGFAELWRSRNPDGREFTWTSPAGNGFRLDHAFASPALAARVVDIFYSHAERTDRISDHSALILDIGTDSSAPNMRGQ